MIKQRIKVTICPEKSLWVGIFERVDEDKLCVARVIFGKEPTDPELYEWLQQNYNQLKYSEPREWQLSIKRKNPKRVLREVKKELKKGAGTARKESLAEEAVRLELEKNKKTRKIASSEEKEAAKEKQFLQNQEKRKKKKRGH